jgi:hypothetical protein
MLIQNLGEFHAWKMGSLKKLKNNFLKGLSKFAQLSKGYRFVP